MSEPNPVRMSWRTRLVVAGACTSGIIVGYDMGIIDGMSYMQTWMGDYGLEKIGPMGVRNVYFGGAVVGAFVASSISRITGRPYATMCGATVMGCATAFQLFRSNAVVAMFARFVAGMGAGCITATGPLYLAEITTANSRSVSIGWFLLTICCGRVLGNGVTVATERFPNRFSYIVPSAITYAWLLPTAISVLCITPESPYHYVTTGLFEQAQTALARIRGLPLDHHFAVHFVHRMKVFYDSRIATYGKPTFTKLWGPEMRTTMFACMFAIAFKFVLGIDYFFKMGDFMLVKIGMQSAALRQLSFGIFEATGYLMSVLSFEYQSDRHSLLLGSCFTFPFTMIYLTIISKCLAINEDTGDVTLKSYTGGVTMAVLSGIAVMFQTFTWGARTWSICAEVLPALHRPFGLSVSIAFFCLWRLLSDISMTYLVPSNTVYKYTVFAIPSFIVVTSFFAYFFGRVCLDDTDRTNCTMVRLDIHGVEMIPMPPRQDEANDNNNDNNNNNADAESVITVMGDPVPFEAQHHSPRPSAEHGRGRRRNGHDAILDSIDLGPDHRHVQYMSSMI